MASWPPALLDGTFLHHVFEAPRIVASRLKIPWSILEIDWLSQRRRTLIQGMEKAGLLDIAPQRQEPVPGSWLVAWDGGGPEKETPAAADCQGAYAWAAVAPDHRTMTAEGGGPLAGPGNPAFEEWDFDMFQEGARGSNGSRPRLFRVDLPTQEVSPRN